MFCYRAGGKIGYGGVSLWVHRDRRRFEGSLCVGYLVEGATFSLVATFDFFVKV